MRRDATQSPYSLFIPRQHVELPSTLSLLLTTTAFGMELNKTIPSDTRDSVHLTTNSGAPVDDSLNSLTLGERGPVLLSDFHLVEKLANFDREVIPERRVHARGVAAKGIFVCTRDITKFTKADPFKHVGKRTPVAGEYNLLDEEAKVVGGEDFSHATNHLIETIESGRFPAWLLKIQLMDPATELDHSWGDPLDPTKTWPEEVFPMITVGRMVLNENMDNHFLESESIAFSPGNVIPGITFSQDKLLQGRIFSYADTQRYRLGANYLQIPINAPRCPFMNRQFDGAGATMMRKSDVNYFPSTRSRADTVGEGQVPNVKGKLNGIQTRRPLSKQNNFGQAGERWRSFDQARRQRLVVRVAEALNAPKVSKKLKHTWIGYWTQCDQELGSRVATLVKMSNMIVGKADTPLDLADKRTTKNLMSKR
ncbi:unnamed protein product [Agarophyton chilense]